MTKLVFPHVTAGILASWVGFLGGCSPVAHDEAPDARALLEDELVGRWRYDSAAACIYNTQGRLLNCFMDPLPPGAVLPSERNGGRIPAACGKNTATPGPDARCGYGAWWIRPWSGNTTPRHKSWAASWDGRIRKSLPS